MIIRSSSAIFPPKSLLRLVYAFSQHVYCSCAHNIPLQNIARTKSNLDHLLQSHATHPPAGSRRPPISIAPRPPPTRDPQQPAFRRLSKFLHSSRSNAVPARHIHPRDPLDFPATSPLPSNRFRGECAPSTSLPGGSAFFNFTRSSSGKGKQKAGVPKRKPIKVVDVPLGQATYADAVGVDDGYRPYVVFFCLSWFQKKEKKPKPQPVYDDEFDDDDDEEENVPAVSPRVQHEEIELKPITSQAQPGAGPSRLAATNHAETRSSQMIVV
ncbi:hypothetical protein EDD22DRAFT_125982 [Suillus occidentalis]|nr:hypothetical protein EDD22DRAFT_125982 [Suillus occidentalis]